MTAVRFERGNIFRNSADWGESPLALSGDLAMISPMIQPSEIPNDVEVLQSLVQAQAASLAEQAATIASQAQKLEELAVEMEKLRKLLGHFVNGHRSEKRILPAAKQGWLPFESSEEFQAARAEAEAQAEAIVQTYTVTRAVRKKKRDESLPSHLRHVERIIEGDDAQKNCPSHGARKIIGYDTTETLALYDIETRAKDLSWQERQALRQRESTVILDAMGRWLDTTPLKDVLPKSDFADALRYIRNHWKELNVYVRDGRIPIDNNSVEQLMKQVAMGRKAWLFVCGVAGGEQSAMMMTLVSSARRHDLDVGSYIKDVLDQLLAGSTDYHSLLPDVWKRSHPEAVRDYRVEERRDKAERKQLRAAYRRLAARRLR